MSHRHVSILFVLFALTLALFPQAAAAQQPCERLSSLTLPHTTITLAKAESAGPFTPPVPDFSGHTKPVTVPAFAGWLAGRLVSLDHREITR